MPLGRTVCPKVAVSWNGSGLYTGPFDDVTSRVAGDPGVTVTLGKDGARTLDPPHVSSCDFELFNDDGRYSMERGDSTVYQLVLPGRPVRVLVEHGDADLYRGTDAYRADDPYRGIATYSVANGNIDDIQQATGWGQQRVSLSNLGTEQLLVASTVTVGVMTNPRIDQCITAILDAVGWPTARRSIAIADTTLTYWWCDDREPWTALMELMLAEGAGAALYVDGSGVFHFENRNYRATATRATASQAVFFDTGLNVTSDAYRTNDLYRADDLYRGTTSGLYFTDLRYDPGYRNIRNRATYTVNTRTTASLGVVWTYGASLSLSPGQSVTLIARPNDPFIGAVTPVSPTDYTVAGGTVSVALAAATGLVAFITITATSGAPTVSGLQLRAQALTLVGSTTVQNSVDASASLATFSPIPGQSIPRVFDVQGWPEIAPPFAQAVCDSWVTRYMLQRPAVEITVVNADAAHVRQIMDRTISDRITVTERNTGLSDDLWINAKTLTLSGAGGRVLTAVFRCEKCEETSGFLWDGASSLWDSATWAV